MSLADKVSASVEAIRAKTALQPEVGIILGTGLGRLASDVAVEAAIHYDEIPGFMVSTVEGHAGRLLVGTLSGRRVCVMQGRLHYYEGYDMADVTYPVRVMKALGADSLIVTNACGGVNPVFRDGDICVITDHINLMGNNPLRGKWEPSMGPRFPPMGNCYERQMVELAGVVAKDVAVPLRSGVYVGLAGPNLETSAEYRMARLIGGDMVGMSTVPEVIVARQIGMRVVGFSVVTNVHAEPGPELDARNEKHKGTTLEDVLSVADQAGAKLVALVREFVRRM